MIFIAQTANQLDTVLGLLRMHHCGPRPTAPTGQSQHWHFVPQGALLRVLDKGQSRQLHFKCGLVSIDCSLCQSYKETDENSIT